MKQAESRFWKIGFLRGGVIQGESLFNRRSVVKERGSQGETSATGNKIVRTHGLPLVHFVGDLGIHFVLNLLAGTASSLVGGTPQQV